MELKSLFIRGGNPNPAAQAVAPSAPDARPAASAHPPMDALSSSPSRASGVSADVAELTRKLAEDFKRVIEQNNIPGIDILEFSKALYNESSTPSGESYSRVFGVLRAVDDKLTPMHLIGTSDVYKKLIQDVASKNVAQGMASKAKVEKAKADAKQKLDAEQQMLVNELSRLEADIRQKKERLAQIGMDLEDVDRKHQGELSEIENKLSAVEQASQQVIGSFEDIENGIRSHLK